LRRVVLDDPVNVRDVNAAGGQVSSQEHLVLVRFVLALELIVDLASFLLVYLAVQLKERGLVGAQKAKD
jgi:hypothetical protein